MNKSDILVVKAVTYFTAGWVFSNIINVVITIITQKQFSTILNAQHFSRFNLYLPRFIGPFVHTIGCGASVYYFWLSYQEKPSTLNKIGLLLSIGAVIAGLALLISEGVLVHASLNTY